VGRAFENACVERGARPERLEVDALGPRPWSTCPPALITALQGAVASVLAIRNEDAEYEARYQFIAASAAVRARHVHMVGVSRKAFVASTSSNVARVIDLLQLLKGAMRPTSHLSVRSAAGTSIEIEIAPHLRWFSNGSVLRQGQWMTVPYGALVSSPASVTGVYVADAAVGGELGARLGLLSNRPVRLSFEGGRVRTVDCHEAMLKRHIERFVAEGQGRERVGLVSVGANVGIAGALGEILHDENAPGVHLSLGETFPSRTGAPSSVSAQLAFAMSEADVDLDGQPLIRRGRYVRFV